MTNDNNSNSNDDNIGSLEEQRIAKAAAALGPVHRPERDLWAGIEAQINSKPVIKAMPSWMPYAFAASVLMTVISLGFSSHVYFNQTKSPIVASNDYIDPIEAIEQPYRLARTSYLEEIVIEGDELSPEIRLVLKENLEIIDSAITEIRKALKQNPQDRILINKLIQTREQEMALFRQLTKHRNTTI